MMKLDFDAELRSADGATLPVYCEVQPPYVGGQKAMIHVAVPAQHITKKPPGNPCVLSGKSGAFTINMQGVHWRRFPCSSKGTLGLEAIELLHIESLTVQHPPMNTGREIRFHLAPISYLRSESSGVFFGDRSPLRGSIRAGPPRPWRDEVRGGMGNDLPPRLGDSRCDGDCRF
jgi:hypothetical protein